MITQGMDRGGHSKQCLSMLQMIAMCLVKRVDDNENVLHRSIFRTVFKSLGRWVTQRLMTKAGKKRKRMEDEDLREFRVVDANAKRGKYDEPEIVKLQKYMCDNRYTRTSPMTKHTIDKRDIYGMF